MPEKISEFKSKRPFVLVKGKKMPVSNRQLEFLRSIKDGPLKVVHYHNTFQALKLRGLAAPEGDDYYMPLATITQAGLDILNHQREGN